MRTCCIVLPLTRLAIGDAIDRCTWPAHVTLVGNFHLPDGAADTAVGVLRRFAAEVPPTPMRIEEEAWFGPGGSCSWTSSRRERQVADLALLRSLLGGRPSVRL